MMRDTFTRAAGIAAIATLATSFDVHSATADPTGLEQQLRALHEALDQQQRLLHEQANQIQELRERLQSSSSAIDSQREANEATRAIPDAPRVAMSGPRPVVTSADGRNSFAPRAIVQLDGADYHENADRGAAIDFRRGSVGGSGNRENNAARDFSDSVYFRRARLGFEGTIASDFSYRFMLDLGGAGTEGPARINDAWIAYAGFAPFTVQLGAFAPPANMDDSTSVESSLFIERATPAELSRTLGGADGRIGLGVRGSGTRWMSALTLTSRTVNDPEVFDSQLAAVARAARLLATTPDYNLHAGVSATWVIEPADLGAGASGARTSIRFRDRPEIRVDSTRLIDTGAIDADGAYAAGVELGANWKNFYVQAENFWYGIERPDTSLLSDPAFGGYYIQGSWIITGESRRYDVASGSFQAPRPFQPFSGSGGFGAWELALRYSRIDLDYRAGAPGSAPTVDAVRGGDQRIWTVGINWYVNPNLRLLFNYLHVNVERLNPAGPDNLTPFGPAPATPPVGAQIGQQLDVYALRTQFNF